MASAFSQALKAITKASNSAFESVRERILPTPGKRKRDRSEENLDNDRHIRRMQGKDQEAITTEGSLHPESQFANAEAPPADLSEVTKAAPSHEPQSRQRRETASKQQESKMPGTSIYNAEPHTVDEGKGLGEGELWGTAAAATPDVAALGITPTGSRGIAPRNSLLQPSGRPTSLAPWQRRYPMYSQAKLSGKDALTIPENLHFSPPRRTDRFGFRGGMPTLLNSTFKRARQKPPRNGLRVVRNDLKDMLQEREILKLMTSNWEATRTKLGPSIARQNKSSAIVDLEPDNVAADGPRDQSRPIQPLKQTEDRALQTWRPEGLSNNIQSQVLWPSLPRSDGPPSLAAAEFQLEKSKEQQRVEEMSEQRRKALDRCADLMGSKQTALLARVSQVLGERPARTAAGKMSQSVAAGISKASMGFAISRARDLESSLSEAELLETQQKRLREARQAQQEAQRTVQSSRKPDTKRSEARMSNGITRAKEKPVPTRIAPPSLEKPEVEVVDLLSSDDEADAPDEEDEAATLHGETSPREGSEGEEVSYSDEEDEEEDEDVEDQEEEDELRARLHNISVTEEVPPGFAALTKQQLTQYRDALNGRAEQHARLKVHKSSNITVTRGLMGCLKERVWLNDEVMNLFMGLLQDRDAAWRASEEYPKCHFFPTFFFNKLYMDNGYNYEAVSRWTRAKRLQNMGQKCSSILDCDRIIAPVHLGMHWTCAMVDLKRKELVYFDSMGGKNCDTMISFRQYIADEFMDKKQQEVDTSTWKIRYNPGKVPQQMNGCDCGVFSLIFAEYLSRDASMTFCQEHMPYFRKFITASIMNLALPQQN